MSLPKGYKRLEYIQSSGTQYVDSGFKPNQDTGLVIDCDFLEANTGNDHHIASVNNSAQYYALRAKADLSCFQVRYNTDALAALSSASLYGRHTFKRDKNKTSVDGGTETVSTYGTFQITNTLPLFCYKSATGATSGYASLKLYSCQIYDNGTLVRDFIPCQNAGGEIGLWDDVNSVFYGNSGTGTFAAGSVVPEQVDESEITELEYIQCSGTQCVDSGFKPNQDTRLVMDVQLISKTTVQFLFNSRGGSSTSYNAPFGVLVKEGSVRSDYGTSLISTTEVSLTDRVIVDKNKAVCTIGEYTITNEANTFQSEYNLILFASAEGGTPGYFASMRLWSCQIYDNGLLERDFIPCKNADGEVGLYDRVYHEFYRNAGTGEFTAGPETASAPKAPANFRVESETDTLVTLAWDPMEEVLGYRLYRQGQLLADTTEPFVSVTVEPFAGAVFTLTAYNENGEGVGTSLTHYSIPENPLLYLITDRTQQDVTERNPKGYYAASDLNRVGYAMDYLANIIRGYGYTLEVSTKTDWTDWDWKLTGEMVKYLQSLNNLKAVFSTLVELPETMEKINYVDANNIEQLLLTIDETVARVVAGFTRANAFALRSGAKGLPVSQSDRGRNWGELDAMETTWANWQLATWYLLLYGNLKAEGVVE